MGFAEEQSFSEVVHIRNVVYYLLNHFDLFVQVIS
jgi:hypothetical protein